MLSAVTFIVFGAVLLGPALGRLTWPIALYAVLSLTVVRMVPVAIAMIGTRRARADRRLSRLVRAARAGFDRLRHPGARGGRPAPRRTDAHHDLRDDRLAVLAHGLTAAPLANRYAAWHESREVAPTFEGSEVQDVRWRRGPGHPPAPGPAGG